MDYVSPVQTPDTNDLIPVVGDIDDRKSYTPDLAGSESAAHDYTIGEQERTLLSALHHETAEQVKARIGYSFWGMVAIFVLAPFLISPFIPTSETVWDLRKQGYSKKWKQRLALMTAGIVTWNVLLYILK